MLTFPVSELGGAMPIRMVPPSLARNPLGVKHKMNQPPSATGSLRSCHC